MKKAEIVWMSHEETNKRMEWAKKRGIATLNNPRNKENDGLRKAVLSELEKSLSAMDFATIIRLVMDVQMRGYGVIFECGEVPYEIDPSTWLGVANKVIATRK